MARLDLDGIQGVAEPAVGSAPTPNLGGNNGAEPQEQRIRILRTRKGGCFLISLLRVSFVLSLITILSISVLGSLGFNFPIFDIVALYIGWGVFQAVENATIRLGYLAVSVPLVLMILTWITARARR